MLGYTSTEKKEFIDSRYAKVRFLIGEYQVQAYNSNPAKGWYKSGSGTTSFTFAETFIKEKVNIKKEVGLIAMENTIGFDPDNEQLIMQTLDLSTGVMDIYKGQISEGLVCFNNKDSNLKAKNKYGTFLTFKLIYKQLSVLENELVVGFSRDNGSTWVPFLKNIYKRV